MAALTFYATPLFWVGLMLVLVFSVWLDWLPSFGMKTVGADLTGGAALLDTARYLVLQTGLVSRHTSTLMLNRVEGLDVDQSLWQRMTGYGTLTIRGTGSEDLRLAGLADPVGFQTEARKAINMASGAPL